MTYSGTYETSHPVCSVLPRASIIITNYNYGRYLSRAIDSALGQTYPNTEVIVVDDGSTDGSRGIIAEYGDRIDAILKENGGQASAFNAGLKKSTGQAVCFLDADDTLLPRALESAVGLAVEPGVAKVHWPLWLEDSEGRRLGGLYPTEMLSEGDLRDQVIRSGHEGYTWSVTSGNIWSRAFLEFVMPMPENEYRGAAESYLATLAPVYGLIRRMPDPLGTYRMHGNSRSNQRLLLGWLKEAESRQEALKKGFCRFGIEVDTASWAPTPETRHNIMLACEELATIIPAGSSFLFVEWNQWGPGRIVADCQAIPFLEKEGQYWGKPADDETAIYELERLRTAGASFIVFAWPALWWLEYYTGLHSHLYSRYECCLSNERVVAFRLQDKDNK